MSERTVLVVNGGSSSLKCRIFRGAEPELEPLFSVSVDSIDARAQWRIEGRGIVERDRPLLDLENVAADTRHAECLRTVFGWMREQRALPLPAVIGHRVVHGGDRFDAAVAMDAGVYAALQELECLAPLHQSVSLALIDVCADLLPGVLQVACFDTMFHQHQMRLERDYALPGYLTGAGIRRYGFHGLSFEGVCDELKRVEPAAWAGRTVIAHLGAGVSLCAVYAGKSVATTMGFSTLDGVPMATRCGSLDPGVLMHLMRTRGMDAEALEDLLYRRSGLLGVSGISGDMRELRASSDPGAAFAIDQFCYRLSREIGSLVAALGGLDALVFTGGIGENDPTLRADVANRCAWLGVRLDAAANTTGLAQISAPESAVSVRVVASREEETIARHALRILGC